MVAGDARRVVVIKNISSDVIEEAILILRNDPEIQGKKAGLTGNIKAKCSADSDFLVKEAETIINSYVRENRIQLMEERYKRKKPGLFRKKTFVNIIINLSLLCGVAFLIYIVCRLI